MDLLTPRAARVRPRRETCHRRRSLGRRVLVRTSVHSCRSVARPRRDSKPPATHIGGREAVRSSPRRVISPHLEDRSHCRRYERTAVSAAAARSVTEWLFCTGAGGVPGGGGRGGGRVVLRDGTGPARERGPGPDRYRGAGGCSWPEGFVEADAERSVRMVRARSGSWGTALLTGESRLGAGAGELAQRELDHGQQRLRRVGAKPALQKFLARGSPGTV